MDIGTKHVVDPRKGSGWKAKKRLAHDTGEDGRCQSALPRPVYLGLGGGAGEPAYTGRDPYV